MFGRGRRVYGFLRALLFLAFLFLPQTAPAFDCSDYWRLLGTQELIYPFGISSRHPNGHFEFGIEMEIAVTKESLGNIVELYMPDPRVWGISQKDWFAAPKAQRVSFVETYFHQLFPTVRTPGQLVLARRKDSGLPRRLQTEDNGKIEFVLEPTDNLDHWNHLVDYLGANIGPGSFQSMLSVNRHGFYKAQRGPDGKAKSAEALEGYLTFFHDFDSLLALERGGLILQKAPGQPPVSNFTTKHNGPINAQSAAAQRKSIEVNSALHPLYQEDLIAQYINWERPFKTIGGTAYRPEIAFPDRLAFEIRGCQFNTACLKYLMARQVYFQQQDLSAFTPFRNVRGFDSVGLVEALPSQTRDALKKIFPTPHRDKNPPDPTDPDHMHDADLVRFDAYRNFTWPLRDWGTHIGLLGGDVDGRTERVAKAQQAYAEELRLTTEAFQAGSIPADAASLRLQTALAVFGTSSELGKDYRAWVNEKYPQGSLFTGALPK